MELKKKHDFNGQISYFTLHPETIDECSQVIHLATTLPEIFKLVVEYHVMKSNRDVYLKINSEFYDEDVMKKCESCDVGNYISSNFYDKNGNDAACDLCNVKQEIINRKLNKKSD